MLLNTVLMVQLVSTYFIQFNKIKIILSNPCTVVPYLLTWSPSEQRSSYLANTLYIWCNNHFHCCDPWFDSVYSLHTELSFGHKTTRILENVHGTTITEYGALRIKFHSSSNFTVAEGALVGNVSAASRHERIEYNFIRVQIFRYWYFISIFLFTLGFQE